MPREPSREFLVGLNYWPATTGMYWWSRFDPEATQDDLRCIAAAGFRYLRFFLLWEAFQPEPNTVSAPALRQLELFANIAHEAGLRLQPTLFTGHMSGANWLPEFATVPSQGPRGRFPTMVSGYPSLRKAANFYAEEELVRAQEFLAQEVARVLAAHPALWSWDLGNEHSNLVTPQNRDQGRRWLERMVTALRLGGSHHPITIGLHMEDLEENRQLGPHEAGEVCDYLSMHGYPFYARWARHSLDAKVLPFLGLVTRWLGGGKEVLFQEFGLPTRATGGSTTEVLFDDAEGAAFHREALQELVREGFSGAFAWCAFDYAEPLWREPPLAASKHERYFGLFRCDRSAKPALDAWRNLPRQLAEDATPPPGRGIEWIDTDPTRFWEDPRGELSRLYARFVQL